MYLHYNFNDSLTRLKIFITLIFALLIISRVNFTFYKYQGTGNDFVIIDNRSLFFPKNNTSFIERLCNRKFGIGADGLLLLEEAPGVDFKMVYFNADGRESSMCGNGARCLVAFASSLGMIENEAVFLAVDGQHHAFIKNHSVRVQMCNVAKVEVFSRHVFLHTGSPHHVQLVKKIDKIDVKMSGRRLRYGKYGREGSNINFVEKRTDAIFSVRTYERGVEDETLSCGTGVVAVALAMNFTNETSRDSLTLQTLGGNLQVSFARQETGYTDIYLEGPAEQVFKGEWSR